VTDSFPRQYARTQRLTLGEPRDLTVAPDGSRIVFARSLAGSDPVNRLWSVDVASGDETLLVDPVGLLSDVAGDDADLPPEERARRERMREGAGGITGYSTDSGVDRAAFALAGHLMIADLIGGGARRLDVPGPVFDPHLSPDGTRAAYVRGRELWVADVDTGTAQRVAGPTPNDPDTVSWGSADFVAAEEMNRYRGFWWSPDGDRLAVCRVDDAPVHVWHIADPADPARTPTPVRYPAAGTPNPEVSLHLVDVDGRADSAPVAVEWDRAGFEYLAKVHWNRHGLTITVLSRDQQTLEVRSVDLSTGATAVVFEDSDDAWVELVPGTGAVTRHGLVVCADRDGARRLLIDDEIVSPLELQVRSVVSAGDDGVVVTANPLDDPTVLHVHRWTPDRGLEALTDRPGIHQAAVSGPHLAIRTAELDVPGSRWTLPSGHQLRSHGETPLVRPNVTLTVDETTVTAVLLPHDHDGSPLPVLLDPYGGPHAQRVVRSHQAFCASQWFADQGFAVVVTDGRGTPGRGSAHERAVLHDLATGVLDDQVTALHLAAERHLEIDLGRVAIRGWSFGGYLAALAVLRRPDVFHAAVAGAPVTEWRLYDTCYTERYLGDPSQQPDVYDANSLLPLADRLTRPLLLIHGLADDNVVAAHTLQMSSALLAAGKPHEVLPLVGVTHMTPQEVVAEHLLLHQLDFLRRHL
jgi:dipeptidyl-peptidase-4